MDSFVNSEGLARLLRHELTRLATADQQLAHRSLQDRFGAYDTEGTTIEREVEAFFNASQVH